LTSLAISLKENTTLETLIISNPAPPPCEVAKISEQKITNTSFLAFADMLGENKTLKVLCLSIFMKHLHL